jgi:hypothetical protein
MRFQNVQNTFEDVEENGDKAETDDYLGRYCIETRVGSEDCDIVLDNV